MYEYAMPARRARRRKSSTSSKAAVRRSLFHNESAAVVTILDPHIRATVDAATQDVFTTVHVDSVSEAVTAVREHTARALLVSPALVRHESMQDIGRLVTKHPMVTPVAILSRAETVSGETLLSLGACGIRRCLTLGERQSWDSLRSLLDLGGGDTEAAILAALLPQLADASDEFRHYFATQVGLAPTTTTVRKLAAKFGVGASTLMSRFFRAKLPAPKAYLSLTRLLYAAAFLEREEVSIVDVATSLDFSSPQSFGRHVRMVLGLTAGEFRRELSLQAGIVHFTDRLIRPYKSVLATFRPLSSPGHGIGERYTSPKT